MIHDLQELLNHKDKCIVLLKNLITYKYESSLSNFKNYNQEYETKITNEIKEIIKIKNNSHKKRIEPAIKDNQINSKNLQILIEIIYNENIKSEYQKSCHNANIKSKIEKIETTIDELQKQIEIVINLIIDLNKNKQQKFPSKIHIIKKIKYNKNKEKTINNLKSEIVKRLSHIVDILSIVYNNAEKKEYNKYLSNIKKDINKIDNTINFEDIIKQIGTHKEAIIKSLNELKKEYISKIVEINIKDNKLRQEILKATKNPFATNTITILYENNTSRKQLLKEHILILKIINDIENNNLNYLYEIISRQNKKEIIPNIEKKESPKHKKL